MRNKCHISSTKQRWELIWNSYRLIFIYVEHTTNKKENKMSYKTVHIKQGESLFIDLPNGDRIHIFTYDAYNDVNVEVARHNGDYTDFPHIDYEKKVLLGNVERKTRTLRNMVGKADVKVNTKALTLSGNNGTNNTKVIVKTFNTQSN